MALAAKRDDSGVRVFALLGDGECNEGQIWEAAMFAAKYKLNNLIAAVDANGLQFDGRSGDMMPMEPLAEKWKAFGWFVREADGHDFVSVRNAYRQAALAERPSMIIFRTVKGKGISYMENVTQWHSGNPDPIQLAEGYRQLGIEPPAKGGDRG